MEGVKKLMYCAGAISMTALIGWGLVVAVSANGLLWTKINATDTNIKEAERETTKIAERVSTLEEAVKTIKEDNKEIKGDLKLILQKLR